MTFGLAISRIKVQKLVVCASIINQVEMVIKEACSS